MAKNKRKLSTKAAVRKAQRESCSSIATVLRDFEKTARYVHVKLGHALEDAAGLLRTIAAGASLYESMADHEDAKPKRKAARK